MVLELQAKDIDQSKMIAKSFHLYWINGTLGERR